MNCNDKINDSNDNTLIIPATYKMIVHKNKLSKASKLKKAKFKNLKLRLVSDFNQNKIYNYTKSLFLNLYQVLHVKMFQIKSELNDSNTKLNLMLQFQNDIQRRLEAFNEIKKMPECIDTNKVDEIQECIFNKIDKTHKYMYTDNKTEETEEYMDTYNEKDETQCMKTYNEMEKMQQSLDTYNGMDERDLYFYLLMKFTKVAGRLYQYSVVSDEHEAAVNSLRESSAIEQLNMKSHSQKPGTFLRNSRRPIHHIFILPDNDDEFNNMAIKAEKNIVAFSPTSRNKFYWIKFNNNNKDIWRKLKKLKPLSGCFCKFYIFGHENSVGDQSFVGSKKTPLLNITELLRYLNIVSADFKYLPLVIITCCNGHLQDKNNYKNIALDCVTNYEKPLAVYFDNHNISLYCHLPEHSQQYQYLVKNKERHKNIYIKLFKNNKK
jgi:hypothetical protein